MKTLIGAAVVAGGLALAGLAAIGPAAAASPKAGVQAIDVSRATDFSSRRRYHEGYSRAYDLARPTYVPPSPYYIRPYPYYGLPFFVASAPAFHRGGIGDGGPALGLRRESLADRLSARLPQR
jgi:hypothetical protein